MAAEHRAYSVKEDDAFLSQAEGFAGSVKQWDDLTEALKLDLARDPTIGEEIPGHENWYGIVVIANFRMTLYYHVNHEQQVITFYDLMMFPRRNPPLPRTPIN